MVQLLHEKEKKNLKHLQSHLPVMAPWMSSGPLFKLSLHLLQDIIFSGQPPPSNGSLLPQLVGTRSPWAHLLINYAARVVM